MAPFDHGRMGHRHDLDGRCARLQGPVDRPSLPWCYRSWSLSRCSILHHHVVLPHRSPIPPGHVLQCRQRRRRFLRPAGLRNRRKYFCCGPTSSYSGSSRPQKMDGVGGYEGWRWIFILEGILTVVVAVIAFFTIYDFPETAKFLTEPERAWVVHRLRYQGSKDSGQMVAESEHFKWQYVRDAFTDWQIYLGLWSTWDSLFFLPCARSLYLIQCFHASFTTKS